MFPQVRLAPDLPKVSYDTGKVKRGFYTSSPSSGSTWSSRTSPSSFPSPPSFWLHPFICMLSKPPLYTLSCSIESLLGPRSSTSSPTHPPPSRALASCWQLALEAWSAYVSEGIKTSDWMCADAVLVSSQLCCVPFKYIPLISFLF